MVSELPSCALADYHVHLGFMSNAEQVAQDAERDGLLLFVNTVTPREYLELRAQPWAKLPNVRLGVGLHPWWVARGALQAASEASDKAMVTASADGMATGVQPSLQTFRPEDYADASAVKLAATLAAQSPWIGEVGLDFSPKHTDPSTHEAQIAALHDILKASAQPIDAGKRVISIHSVASADVVLDLLEETGAAKTCSCIFHWFSGSTPALWRAIHMGCWFSVNERQARTRRAKEQLKLIPCDRLLLETDFPPQKEEPFEESRIVESLDTACKSLAAILNVAKNDITGLTSQNAEVLLND